MSTDLESSLVKNYLETLERCGYESFDYADFEMEYCLQLAGSLEGIFSHVVIAPEPEALKVRPVLEELCRVLTSITL
jgi:hypothetical protein